MIGMLGRYGESATAPDPLVVHAKSVEAARAYDTYELFKAYAPVVDTDVTKDSFDQAKSYLAVIRPSGRRSNAFPPRPGWLNDKRAQAQTVAVSPVVVEKETDWKMIALIGLAGAVAGKILLGKG